MLKVGLTGNIGSGKSLVADIFKTIGIPVYHADEESKKFLDDPFVKNEVIRKFGYGVLSNNREIEKRVLASLVFSDPEALQLLTSILHPRVKRDFIDWTSRQEHKFYVLQESAIIFEYGLQDDYDRIIHVSCPPEVSLERVIARDQLSRQEVLRRMKFQLEDEKKAALSDFIIRNDGSQLVIPQVMSIHQFLLEAGS